MSCSERTNNACAKGCETHCCGMQVLLKYTHASLEGPKPYHADLACPTYIMSHG